MMLQLSIDQWQVIKKGLVRSRPPIEEAAGGGVPPARPPFLIFIERLADMNKKCPKAYLHVSCGHEPGAK